MKSQNDVFISYSHADVEYLNQLKRHFKPFIGRIRFWDDSCIMPGKEWKIEVSEALENAKVALFLISADFFNSDFITKIEVPALLKSAEEKGVLILTVILKPCLFEEYPEINKYQSLNSPDYTIIQMTEVERERVWIKTVKRISSSLQ